MSHAMRRQPREKPLLPRNRLAWLLDFAKVDVDALSRPAIRRLTYEVRAFLGAAGSRPSAWAEDRGGGGRECPRTSGHSLSDRDPLPALRSRQDRTKALLAALRTEQAAPTDARLELRLAEVVWQQEGSPVTWRAGGDECHRFEGALAIVLQQYGAGLRRCPGHRCAQVFVKWHRQRYCSKACRIRTEQARYRQRHPQAPRQRYEARIRKRLPKAKIASRARQPA